MKKYEVLYILAANLDEAAKEAYIARFENLVKEAGGEATVNKWGVRKLAYPVNYKTEGYYVLMDFTANADLPLEIERQMRIAKDEILRFMIIVKE
ncbi:MAG: 30S ribosomal protein S6 [Ruminococcaceae bacterium]|nr:30S ribosomal protein S6 [Oscillospiraceae bacterium]